MSHVCHPSPSLCNQYQSLSNSQQIYIEEEETLSSIFVSGAPHTFFILKSYSRFTSSTDVPRYFYINILLLRPTVSMDSVLLCFIARKARRKIDYVFPGGMKDLSRGGKRVSQWFDKHRRTYFGYCTRS